MTQDNLNPRDEFTNELERVAQSIHPNPAFQAELEEKLKAAHKPKRGFLPVWRNILPAVGWTVALAALAFALNWGIRNLAPLPPQPASNGTSDSSVFDISNAALNDSKIIFKAALPTEAPEMSVYLVQPNQAPTLEGARSLASQLGMSGNVYLLEPNYSLPSGELSKAQNYLVVDGNQRLEVRSNETFTYYPDSTALQNFKTADYNGAEKVVSDFLAAKGFGITMQVEKADMPGYYTAASLTADGTAIRNDSLSVSGLTFIFTENGLIEVIGNLVSSAPVSGQKYRIISAQEALAHFTDPNATGGYIAYQSSMPTNDNILTWVRSHPADQTVTIWKYFSSQSSAEGGDQLVTTDGYTVTGNIADFPPNTSYLFVEATGQFQTVNGAKVFHVDTWQRAKTDLQTMSGSVSAENSGVYFTNEQGKYLLPDPPPGMHLPMEPMYVTGVIQGGTFEWSNMGNSPGGGGGGGGGYGFYKLNLSGTPVPFPTPTSLSADAATMFDGAPYLVVAGDTCQSIANAFNVDVQTIIAVNHLAQDCSNLTIDQTILVPYPTAMAPQEVHVRGTLSVTIFEKPDGSKRAIYRLTNLQTAEPPDTFQYLELDGEGLDGLQQYNELLVDVWGTYGELISIDGGGTVHLSVTRFEPAFPGLKWKIIQGRETMTEVNGQPTILFTTEDGTTYSELLRDCLGTSGNYMVAIEGQDQPLVQLEALVVPDLTFGGYPALCVAGGGPMLNPSTGEPIQLEVNAGTINSIPEPPGTDGGAPLTLTIEKIELVYYTPNQSFYDISQSDKTIYMQPVWRFYGHFSDGTPFEALVQALDPIYLLPEFEDIFFSG